MSERKPQYQFIKHVSGVVIAVATVTAASILWEIPQKYGTTAVNVVYFTSAFLLLLGGFLVFRRIVLRSYLRYRQLNPLASFLQLLIWGLFFAFPCIYLPGNWA